MCTDYFRQIVMFGGTPQLYLLNLWMGGNFTDAQEKLRVPPIARAFGSQIFNNPSLKKLWWPQMQKRLAKIQDSFMGKNPARAFNELFASWVIDGKTRETNSIPPGPYQQMAKVQVPFVVAQNPGHLNLHQFGAYDLFQNAATPKDRKWLIIGPAEYDLPCMHWQLEALAFFDHLLHGADNGYAQQPPVRYYTDGAGDYRTAADFPIPGSQTVRLHPASGGAGDAMHPHTPDAAEAAGTGSWAAVPIGAPVTAGFDEVANQIVSCQVNLGDDTEFCGPVPANLSFACDQGCAPNWRFGFADRQPWPDRKRAAPGGHGQPDRPKARVIRRPGGPGRLPCWDGRRLRR